MLKDYYYKLRDKQYRYFISDGKKALTIDSYGQHKPVFAGEQFDYIVLAGTLGSLDDIQTYLQTLRKFCHKDTRVIVEYYSYLWQYILKLAEKIGIKKSEKVQNWLTWQDIFNFLNLADYEPIKTERCILLPLYIPIISYLVNKYFAKLPIFNALTLNHFIIARPLFKDQGDYSVTILVPCRNEKGNIEAAITRTPEFGTHQEFIFVEGHSKDGTYEEVERVMKVYPSKDIKFFKQTAK